MPPSRAETEPPRPPDAEGGWIGIDLGTSNCAAAVWDPSRSRCKVLRLGRHRLARPPVDGGRKGGKIVPSAVLFYEGAGGDAVVMGGEASGIAGVRALVGHAAVHPPDGGAIDGTTDSSSSRRAKALVTSFKRVVGMTARQARELLSSDPEFWNSLPFRPVIIDDADDGRGEGREDHLQHQSREKGPSDEPLLDGVGGAAADISQQQSSAKSQAQVQEGVRIQIQPLSGAAPQSDAPPSEHLVTPLQVTTLVLKSIRLAATECLTNQNKSNIQAPGRGNTSQVRNCIIGVPAHYSQAQRTAVQSAAKEAGFRYVGIMTESTAAAMAYGLFVSPNTAADDAHTNGGDGGKNILVFDMGGGTTDVTFACIDFGTDDQVQFRVLATAGDQCLGGDNVDELLARHLMNRLTPPTVGSDWRASEHQELINQCRRAKEELCGNAEESGGEQDGMAETHVTIGGKRIKITRGEFDTAIQPLVDRAERVVDDALSALDSYEHTNAIHEVILVGGSTHLPTVRTMLRRKFPPPVPPELCTSLSAETAVAQGLAVQAALVSGTVPLWELRNAMMLDAVPHSIGVWVDRGNAGADAKKDAPFDKGDMIEPKTNGMDRGHFVPILAKDSPLPARASATFTLATSDQSGVTVIAAELIGPGEACQCMGTFSFLLHRIDSEHYNTTSGGIESRQIEIGMTLDADGKFTVSIFDECDPEHREKRRRYLREKAVDDEGGGGGGDLIQYYEEEEKRQACSVTEIGLALFCIVCFALYVATRIAFSDLSLEADATDEL
ncbi:hypothetical protein ACHAXT_002292 [Thalassiosira profunda]